MSINDENKFYQIFVILNLTNFNLQSTMYFVSKSTKTFLKNFWITDFLIKWSKVKVAQLCPTVCNPMAYTVHGIFQARILECLAFPFSKGSSKPRDRTQVSHSAGRFFTSLSHKESPRTLEWVAYPFSRGSSQLRNQTGVSCIAGGFFTNWAIVT